MKIDVICPQCKQAAFSKIKKITVPGQLAPCKSCKAEITIEKMFSGSNIFSIVLALPLIVLFPKTIMFWAGWFVLFVGCTFHLAKVPLKIVNAGPNHAKYKSN